MKNLHQRDVRVLLLGVIAALHLGLLIAPSLFAAPTGDTPANQQDPDSPKKKPRKKTSSNSGDKSDTDKSNSEKSKSSEPKKTTSASEKGKNDTPASKPADATTEDSKFKIKWPWKKDDKGNPAKGAEDKPKTAESKDGAEKSPQSKKEDPESPPSGSRTAKKSKSSDDSDTKKKKSTPAKSDKSEVAKDSDSKGKSSDAKKTAAKADAPAKKEETGKTTAQNKNRKPKSSGDTDEASSDSKKNSPAKSDKTAAKGSDEKTKKTEAKKPEPKKEESKDSTDVKKEVATKEAPTAEPGKPEASKPEPANSIASVSKKEESDKPAFRVPEANVKDVTESRGDHKMEPAEGEFEKHDPADPKTKPEPKPSGIATVVPSSEMQGWEVMRMDGRDYVTSESLHKFYRFPQHEISGGTVVLKSSVLVLKGSIGSQDLLINGIKFILSYPLAEANGKILISRLDLCKLIDPVLRPSYINNAAPFDTVIVDAGHGGHDSGARGVFGYEKDYALKLAYALKTDLEQRGLRVILTRKDDTFISLEGRVVIANQIPNSIFVALHFNSGPSAATGIETYALSPQGSASIYGARSVDNSWFNGNQRDSENIALATAIHAMVIHRFRLVDRGVKRARWYVLTGLQRPGVLFEGGFVSNEADGRLIGAENFREELAKTIGGAIMNYRRALQH